MNPVLKVGETSVRAYGREWTFPRRGHPDHFRARDLACQEATKFGKQLLETMATQKGSPLNNREVVMGRLDEPNVPQPIAHLTQREASPDDNPFAARLAELRGQRPMLAADRARLARRIESVQGLSNQWETERAAARVIEARNADVKVGLMREHARASFDHSRLDSRATPAEVSARRRLLDLANSDTSDPADYWRESNEADTRWYARLDALAAEKSAVVKEAKAELTEARTIAKEARKVDYTEAEPVAESEAANG